MMKHLCLVNAGRNLLPDLGFHQMSFWELVIVDLVAILLVQTFARLGTLVEKIQTDIMSHCGDQVQITLKNYLQSIVVTKLLIQCQVTDDYKPLERLKLLLPHELDALRFWCAVKLRFVMVLNAFGTIGLLLWRIGIFLSLHFPFRFDGLLLGF
jgi:hypothetical protein